MSNSFKQSGRDRWVSESDGVRATKECSQSLGANFLTGRGLLHVSVTRISSDLSPVRECRHFLGGKAGYECKHGSLSWTEC